MSMTSFLRATNGVVLASAASTSKAAHYVRFVAQKLERIGYVDMKLANRGFRLGHRTTSLRSP